jgi:hypothetical protein
MQARSAVPDDVLSRVLDSNARTSTLKPRTRAAAKTIVRLLESSPDCSAGAADIERSVDLKRESTQRLLRVLRELELVRKVGTFRWQAVDVKPAVVVAVKAEASARAERARRRRIDRARMLVENPHGWRDDQIADARATLEAEGLL